MKKSNTQTLFGTDGIRGRANVFPMTVEIALSLGRALGSLLREIHDEPRVVVGKDTRLSCYMFENALVAGMTSMGVDTWMVGPLPTPGVAFITRAYRAHAGIVISASHNPYYDNGIKIFSAEGYKLPDSLERKLESIISTSDFGPLPKDAEVGRNTRIADADGRYIEYAKATLPKSLTLKNLRIFLDCAHGAAHRVAPAVFWELDAQVFLGASAPNGFNINEKCGALHPKNAQKGVLETKSDVGIALDGDGDRCVMVDEKGHVVDGDVLLAICATELKKRGLLKNDRVVGTILSNLGVIRYLQKQGIEVFHSQVGDRYVLEEMLSKKAYIGGEQSGHLIFLDYNTTGDGIVTALQLLRFMVENGKSLSALAAEIPKYPQVHINIPVRKKIPFEELPSVRRVIEKAESSLGERGRVIVRYSGTEDLCRIVVEGSRKSEIAPLAGQIAEEVKKAVGC